MGITKNPYGSSRFGEGPLGYYNVEVYLHASIQWMYKEVISQHILFTVYERLFTVYDSHCAYWYEV